MQETGGRTRQMGSTGLRQSKKVSNRLAKAVKQGGKMRIVPEYPNRDIPSPEPVMGRQHCFIQTETYIEELTDKPQEESVGVATEFYLDRPPVPLFQPRMPAKENCKST